MPIVEHRGHRPRIDPTAYVAPTAVLCGDVRVGPGARILFGAVLTAEDGRVSVGARTVVMEHALVRGRDGHPAVIGDDVLVGPHSHVNGAVVEDGCFVATGAAVFPGARLGTGTEVRIHGVVQVNTDLPAGSTVPIGWVAVGRPVQILPPDRHDDIWAVQRELDFPGTVYGVPRGISATELMTRQSAWFAAHRDDRIALGDDEPRPPSAPPDGLPRYRVLTGPDDAALCHRVSEALALGYELHGGPALTHDGSTAVVAQAIVWPLS
jgi:carbonic anhydrase/acetyltransferase-like protein (isoleucine patch superfamily)